MKKFILLAFILSWLAVGASAQSNVLTVTEVDGTPRKTGITTLVFSNGSVTINGTRAVVTSGGGGAIGGAIAGGTPNSVLFVDGSGNLGQDNPGLAWTASTNSLLITSASATAVTVGPNGATNPAFNIAANGASAATGINLITSAATFGVTLQVTSSGANEDIILAPKGTGHTRLNSGRLIFTTNSVALEGQSATLIRAINAGATLFVDFAARNFLVSTATIGTSGASVIAIPNGTAPTSSPADEFQMYAGDAAAGDANAYIRNEAGEITRLSGLGIRNSAQFDKTSDTTLANIPGLTRNVEAGRIYAFTATLPTTSNSSGGVKAAVAGTATATSIIYDCFTTDAGATVQTRATALATACGGATAVSNATILIRGTIVVNAAGTLTVQFAQNASNGSASSVLANATWVITPI